MGHGVLGTASTPSLEQTMGGLHYTQAGQRVPRTTAGKGTPSSGAYFGQDLQTTPKSDKNGKDSPKTD